MKVIILLYLFFGNYEIPFRVSSFNDPFQRNVYTFLHAGNYHLIFSPVLLGTKEYGCEKRLTKRSEKKFSTSEKGMRTLDSTRPLNETGLSYCVFTTIH